MPTFRREPIPGKDPFDSVWSMLLVSTESEEEAETRQLARERIAGDAGICLRSRRLASDADYDRQRYQIDP